MAEYINKAEGLKRVMNNAKLFTRLLTKMKTDCGGWVSQLEAQLEAGKLKEAQGTNHTIKGAAANLSLIDLNQRAIDLEVLIKEKNKAAEAAGQLDAARPDDYNEAMKAEFAKLRASFDGTVQAIDEETGQNG